MSQSIVLRCSSLPRVLVCPGSALSDAAMLVTEASDPAALGTAVHEALQEVVSTGAPAWDGVADLAAAHGVDEYDARVLVALGAKLWAAVSGDYPNAQTEVPLMADLGRGVVLTGRADVVSVAGRVGRVADWKTGRVDSDYRAQLLGYAALVLLDRPDLDAATGTILWVRDGDAEHYTLRREDLSAWVDRVVETVTTWDGRTYTTGPHCTHCPLRATCDAYRAQSRSDVAALAGLDAPTDLSALPPAKILDLYDLTARVEKLAERMREAFREHVRTHGPVEAPGGGRLALEDRTRRELDPMKAWGVLTDLGFQDDDFAAVMDLRLSRIEDRVAKRADKGKGAAAVRDLKARLETAGAVTTTTTTTTRRTR